MTHTPEPLIYRYDVTFEAAEIEQGRSFVTLALSQNGQDADQTTLFFFEVAEGMTSEATKRLVQFLNRYIVRFGAVIAEPPEPESP
jgi:hypothetical protein